MRKHDAPAWQATVVLEMRQQTHPVTELAAAYETAPRWRREGVARRPDLLADPAVAAHQAAVHDAQVEQRYAQSGQRTTPVAGLQQKSGLAPDA